MSLLDTLLVSSCPQANFRLAAAYLCVNNLVLMPRSANSHLLVFTLLALFALLFAGFLLYAAYFYFTDGENMTLKSFAPGVPAFFLGFLARNEFRAMRAARKTEARMKARRAEEPK